MEVEIEILNLKDEIKALKRDIEVLKSANTKLIDDTTNLQYRYSNLEIEKKIIVAKTGESSPQQI